MEEFSRFRSICKGFAFSGNLFSWMKEKVIFRENLFSTILSNFSFLKTLLSLMMNSRQIFGERVWIYIKKKKKSEGFSFGSSDFCSWILASNVAIFS